MWIKYIGFLLFLAGSGFLALGAVVLTMSAKGLSPDGDVMSIAAMKADGEVFVIARYSGLQAVFSGLACFVAALAFFSLERFRRQLVRIERKLGVLSGDIREPKRPAA